MQRIEYLDFARGILFIPMLIYHIVVFYDMKYGTTYSMTPHIDILGNVRLLYIFIAGISIYLYTQTRKEKTTYQYIKDRIQDSLILLIYALIITIVSHITYPHLGIKFGILHFIFIGTLIVGILLKENINLVPIAIIIFLLSQTNLLNNKIICGPFANYSSLDSFPILQYLPLLMCGSIVGKYIINKSNEKNKKTNIINVIGKKSLDLYFFHFVSLLVL